MSVIRWLSVAISLVVAHGSANADESPDRVANLVKQLGADDPFEREQALLALAELGPKAASSASAVARLLGSAPPREAPSLPYEAKVTLDRIGSKAVPSLLERLEKGDEADRKENRTTVHEMGPAYDGLETLGRSAIPALIRALASDDPSVQSAAVTALARIGPAAAKAMPVLVRIQDSEDIEVAVRSLAARVHIGEDPKALAALVRLAQSKGRMKRLMGIWGLGTCGRYAAEHDELLIKSLDDRDELIAQTALDALVGVGRESKRAGPVLAKRVKATERDYGLLLALPEFGADTEAAIPELIKGLSHERAEIANACCDALAAIGPKAKAAAPELLKAAERPGVEVAALLAFVAIGTDLKSAQPVALRVLETRGEYAMAAAMRVLAAIGPDAKNAVPDIKPYLRDERAYVRLAAVLALIRIEKNAAEYTPLITREFRVLPQPDPSRKPSRYSPEASAAGAFALLAPDCPELIPPVAAALPSLRADVKKTVLRGLFLYEKAAKPAVPALIAILEKEQDPAVLAATCVVLSQIGPGAAAALPRLRELTRHPLPMVTSAAEQALRQIEGL